MLPTGAPGSPRLPALGSEGPRRQAQRAALRPAPPASPCCPCLQQAIHVVQFVPNTGGAPDLSPAEPALRPVAHTGHPTGGASSAMRTEAADEVCWHGRLLLSVGIGHQVGRYVAIASCRSAALLKWAPGSTLLTQITTARAPPGAKKPPTHSSMSNGPFFLFTASTRLNTLANAPCTSPDNRILGMAHAVPLF